ncbi:hypothetical protein [Nocardia vinacea]|uniref:hypothetical protein n=1 Tax=Nocardia vinacea TaxID=96468 RepID=UPI0012F6A0A1|nr:hypothetical protein [Nocardia vinacea]
MSQESPSVRILANVAITAGICEGAGWVPVVLALFGLGSFAGVTLTGRHSDRHRWRIITAGTWS